MRLKNVKGANEIIINGKYYLANAYQYKGKWNEVFDNDNKELHIEIGMGKGNFIINNALKYPHINFIGIEKFDSVIVRAIQKSNELELNNLKIVRMDASNIEDVFDKEIDTLYLNFSDPWPKDRHAKRRLTSDNFLAKYESIFKKDKHIIMKTDNIDLFNFSLECFDNNNYKILNITNDLANENIDNIKTEYEERFMDKGIKINRVEVIKKGDDLSGKSDL